MNTECVVIEKGLPVPPSTRERGAGKWQKVVNAMEVGDSVVLTAKESAMLSVAIRKAGYRPSVRTIGKNQIRVWKLA